MLLDYVDIVVHVQHAEERVFYALERLWKDCPTSSCPTRSAGRPGDGVRRDRARSGDLSAPAGRAAGVVLWRHGQTAWNARATLPGQHRRRARRRRAGRRPPRRPAARRPGARPRIVSSDLPRRDTAAALAAAPGSRSRSTRGCARPTAASGRAGPRRDRAATREEYAAWRAGASRPGRRRRDASTEVAARVCAADRSTRWPAAAGGHARRGHPRRHRPRRHRPLLGLPAGLGASSAVWPTAAGPCSRRRPPAGWRLLEHNAGTLPEPVLGDDD